MPALRNTHKRSVSQGDPCPLPPPYTDDFTFGSETQSIRLLDPYSFPASASDYRDNSGSPPVAKKKRSHGKARPPGHIPRPPNAFIIFRTEYIRSMATHSTPEMSKNLGIQWKNMSALEKRPWIEKARMAKEEHMRQYPDYKYKPVHPRDAEGKCIRKPRKPNKTRARSATTTDTLEHLSTSFVWMESGTDAELQGTSLPSNSSSASSPPISPSPFTSRAYLQLSYRRSSSVPLPGSDERFLMLPETGDSVYPTSPNGIHTSHVTRRLSKRPSTSMDFTCAGPVHLPELYVNNNVYLPGDVSHQWRPGHRHSISAPSNGDIPTGQFMNSPSQEFSPDGNHLTPINPVFGHVFDKFSWDSTSNTQYSNIVPPQPPYAGLDIPSMTHSPLSNGSATPPPSSPSHTPIIQHPAPISTFDLSAFQDQIGDFDAAPHADAGYMALAPESVQNALDFVPRPYQARQVDNEDALGGQTHTTDQGFYRVEQQQGHASATPLSEEVQTPSMESPRSPFPRNADMIGYEEGLQYTQPTQPLDFSDLIAEGYQ